MHGQRSLPCTQPPPLVDRKLEAYERVHLLVHWKGIYEANHEQAHNPMWEHALHEQCDYHNLPRTTMQMDASQIRILELWTMPGTRARKEPHPFLMGKQLIYPEEHPDFSKYDRSDWMMIMLDFGYVGVEGELQKFGVDDAARVYFGADVGVIAEVYSDRSAVYLPTVLEVTPAYANWLQDARRRGHTSRPS